MGQDKRLVDTLSWLGRVSPYAWIPALIVSSVSAYFAYMNYTLQVSGSRPQMIFNRTDMTNPYDEGILSLGMMNVGTRTAYDYQLAIKTVDIQHDKTVNLAVISASNPIPRQGGISAEPRLDMTKFLDLLVLCATYRDDRGKTVDDLTAVDFPTMTRGLTKDKGGGGQYVAASVSPDVRRKVEKMGVCKD
jgi:hypothetical protein